MAGTVKTNIVQLGDSSTPSQNLVIRTNVDGTFSVARGNAGATTQDILTIDANGRIAMPQNVVTFYAYRTATQSIPHGTYTKVQFNSELFDPANSFDAVTDFRFQPTVAGYYLLTAQVGFSMPNLGATIITEIGKNSGQYTDFTYISTIAGSPSPGGSTVMYLNGTTDFADVFAHQNTGAPVNTIAGKSFTFFQGHLIAKA